MLYKINKIITLMVLFILIGFVTQVSAKASDIVYDSGDDYIGGYAVTEPVKETTKVYINNNLVDFVKKTGRDVYVEERKILGITYKTMHYYYASKYVEKIVEIREMSNDIDSVIFMVSELEKKAIEYNEKNYKNLVLGYIRSINIDYDKGYFEYWVLLAGDTPTDFISYVNMDNSHGLKINEFFSSFLSSAKYNTNKYGMVDEQYQKGDSTWLKLIDPYDNTKGIDLIHMFASIDGIYAKTGNNGINVWESDAPKRGLGADLSGRSEYNNNKTNKNDFLNNI